MGGQRSTEWEAKWCAERAPQLHTKASPLELLTDRRRIESCSPEAVRILCGQPRELQRRPPAQLQKLVFLGLKSTFGYYNQVYTEYQKGTKNSIKAGMSLYGRTYSPAGQEHTHTHT